MPDAELNNSQGRAPGDMVWRYSARADQAQANSQEVAEMLWDVSKAFETVNRGKLVALAEQLGYPNGSPKTQPFELQLAKVPDGWKPGGRTPIPHGGNRDGVGFCHFRSSVLCGHGNKKYKAQPPVCEP